MSTTEYVNNALAAVSEYVRATPDREPLQHDGPCSCRNCPATYREERT